MYRLSCLVRCDCNPLLIKEWLRLIKLSRSKMLEEKRIVNLVVDNVSAQKIQNEVKKILSLLNHGEYNFLHMTPYKMSWKMRLITDKGDKS